MTTENRDTYRSGERTTAVLMALAEGPEFSPLTVIARRAALPVSTVHRILDQLVQLDFARRGPNRLYGVGLEFSRIGALAAQKLNVARIARPYMASVTDNCNETSLLSLYLPSVQQMAFVEKVDSKYPLKYLPLMHVHRTLLLGASGKIILSWLPGDVRKEIIASRTNLPTAKSEALDIEKLEQSLALTREQGYLVTYGERNAGAVGLAAPIFQRDASVVAGLCLTIPAFRHETHKEKMLISELCVAARRISAALGYAGEPPQS